VWLECTQKKTFNYFGDVIKVGYWSVIGRRVGV